MDSEITDIIIPSAAFFIAFFMAFTLLELIIILIINRYIYRNWVFFTDVIVHVKVHHGETIGRLMRVFVIVFLALLISFTSVLEILVHSEMGVKVLAVEMFLIMVLIYLRTTRKIPNLNITKTIHKYLYVYLSGIVYILVIVLVNQHYLTYQKFINTAIANPLAESSSEYLENHKRKTLLSEFRQQIYSHECPRVDFTNVGNDGSTKHFVYVTTHPELKLMDRPINPNDRSAYLTGRLCSNSEEKFLLTDYGQWYWVVDDK